MPAKGQTQAEIADWMDRVLCAIVDAHQAGRYPSARLISQMTGMSHTTVKAHINRLRDQHYLSARYGERHSLVIHQQAFDRRQELLATIPVFAIPHRRRRYTMDALAGGLTTKAIHGVEYYREIGRISASRPGARERFVAALAIGRQRKQERHHEHE